MSTTPFTILDHLPKLTVLKEENTQYVCRCPTCNGDRLTIDKKSGAYHCWHNCECKDIRAAIAPRSVVKQDPKTLSNCLRPAPAVVPCTQTRCTLTLAKLPGPATDSPQPQKRLDDKLGEVTVTRYLYSPSQWVERMEWKDETHPKGHRKRFTLWHLGEDGQPVARKGSSPWAAYRLDEALQAAVASQADTLMMVEGEKAVESYRQLGLACTTLQGSDWGKEPLQRLVTQLQANQLQLVYHPDYDQPGQKKAQKLQQECARAHVRCLVLDPLAIDPELPEAGDIADIVAAGLSHEDIISRLDAESQRQLEAHLTMAEGALTIPDTFSPQVEFNQEVLKTLYADRPWLCVNGTLYYWTGTYYKQSPSAVEENRLWRFCNTYPVDQKGQIRYPYAKASSVNAALDWVKLGLSVDPALINPAGINCTNGVLQIHWGGRHPSWTLVPHSHTLFYLYPPIATYDPAADSTHCDQLLEALDAPQREIFLRTIAASLDLKIVRKYQGRLVRGLLLKGQGNNGKDALRGCVSAMYGNQGITGCTLSDFKTYDNGRKFPLARLEHSRVNWATENANTASLDHLQSIKAFLTGDTLSKENKGKDEYDFLPAGVGLFNVNDTPKLQASLEAIISRWGVLLFDKTFKIGADPGKGELEADPRFKYDPDFLQTQVVPAFLNRVLQALVDLMTHGIDYSATAQALAQIQLETSHLFQFCQDTGLEYDPEGVMGVGELWECLKAWYINNGVLILETNERGNERSVWIDQVSRSDQNVKGANQVLSRFCAIFPQAKRVSLGNHKQGIQGLSFKPTAMSQLPPER